jgi:hypothetical protein
MHPNLAIGPDLIQKQMGPTELYQSLGLVLFFLFGPYFWKFTLD